MANLAQCCDLPTADLIYRDLRAGDVHHPLDDIIKAQNLLGYVPIMKVGPGIKAVTPWCVRKVRRVW